MRPQPISIPSSTNSEQVETPNWAGSGQAKQNKNQNLSAYDKYHMGGQIPKMSRLDQLLSRNQEIYQNMRVQLQQISKSNQNIDANINIIKPMYQSQTQCQEQPSETRSQQNEYLKHYLQMYSFQNQNEQQEDARNSIFKRLNKSERMQQSTNYRKTEVRPQGYAVYDIQVKQSKISKSNQIIKHEQKDRLDASHQLKMHLQKVEQVRQQKEVYLQPDSSPIESQNHYLGSKSSSTQDKSTLQFMKNQPIRVRLFATKQEQKEISRDKYETFEQDENGVTNQVYRQQLNESSTVPKLQMNKTTDYTNKGDNNTGFTNIGYTNTGSNKVQIFTRPTQLSMLFIPFNRLYSSPILKQTGPQQLVLSRRSKTQVIPINSLDRIVDGIKYKCAHLVHEEASVYSAAVDRIRKIGTALRVSHSSVNIQSEDKQQNGVDLGIVGGRNSLKKKLHYALIAHIYTDALQLINSYFNDKPESSRIIFTIQHQVQVSNQEPTIISYKASFSESEVQNEIELGNINAIISQIFDSAKSRPAYSTHGEHVIRVTRVSLYLADTGSVLSNTRLISTNKMDSEFVASLNLDVVIWCVNPLVKYYEDTFKILQCYNAYNLERKAVVDRKNQTSSAAMGGLR